MINSELVRRQAVRENQLRRYSARGANLRSSAAVLSAILAFYPIMASAQAGPFASPAAVTLDVQPAAPVAGSDFAVAVYVNLEGVTNLSSAPAALGAFVIPVAFDAGRVTLKSVAPDPASGFAPDLIYTDVQKANARGCVTLVNARIETGIPAGNVRVATLTFTANQGGTVRFNTNYARSRWEGSLASTHDRALAGGPSPIPYTDKETLAELRQGDTPYRLIFPSFVSTASDFQGVALVNESSNAADLTFRAFSADGSFLAGNGMTNPATPPSLAPHTQYVKVVEEMFSLRESLNTARGWIEVESTSPNTSGFFLVGHVANGTMTELDGADVSHSLTAHAIFPVIGNDAARDTEICLINPSPVSATGSLRLRNSDGTTRRTIPVTIPAHGAFEQTLQSTAVAEDGYAELEMSSGMVAGLEKFGNSRALACLAAQDADKASNALWAPHMASGKAGARYFTEISVINTGSRPANAVFRLLNDEGVESVSPVTRRIAAWAQLKIRADRLFGLPDPAADGYVTGVITVECDSELVGSITISDPDGAFLSSLPLLPASSAKREVYLDHIALGRVPPITFWTGVALVNASRERDAQAVIRLYRPGGELAAQATKTIPRKGRLLKLVSELGPGFDIEQSGGFMHITSNVELFATMLFGDTGFTLLSAVPVR